MKSSDDKKAEMPTRPWLFGGAWLVAMLAGPAMYGAVAYWGAPGLILAGAVHIIALFSLGFAMYLPRRAEAEAPAPQNHRDTVRRWLDERLGQPSEHQRLAVLAITVEVSETLVPSDDRLVPREVVATVRERLSNDLREDDLIARGDVTDILLCLSRLRAPQTETLDKLINRLRQVAQDPIEVGGDRVYPRLTIGVAATKITSIDSAGELMSAAEDAHDRAAERGVGTIIMAGVTPATPAGDDVLAREVARALENGQITAWYQPQFSTETGDISGFEALARWEHPSRGIVSPASFLPIIVEAGLSRRLAKVILKHTLSALRTWDRAGLGIPGVGVNFSAEELSDPNLADFLRWELDRFALAPERLVVEVLETVISESHDDAVSRNLRSLSGMGCRIDLDDFGTGFTSIINIQRFDVSRIKIDRKLVSGAATDPGQRTMIAAVLSMSEHLQVETLGEGVESKEEQLTLAQLGCGHVQGFAIARPMPLGDTLAWTQDHRARMASATSLAVSPNSPR